MRWKTTLGLVLAVLGLGTYISLVEIRRPTARQQEGLAKLALDLPPETVTRLAIDLPETTLTLVRDGTRWMIVPEGFRADAALVEGFLAQLAPLTAERVLRGGADQPLPASAYGLAPAVGRITLVTRESATTLLVGETTPVGQNRYVQLAGAPEIFVVPDTPFASIRHPVELFRDPYLLTLDGWLLDALAVAGPAPFALARSERGWRLTQPVADRADTTAVGSLLQRLGRLRIQRFIDADPQHPSAGWGFDTPAAEFRLREHDADLRLTVGATVPDAPDLRYARRSDEPFLYAVSDADVRALLPDPHTLRAQACFEATAGQIRLVEVAWAGAAWGMQRAGTGWTEQHSGAALDAAVADRVLLELTILRLERFVEEQPADLARYGLQPPAGTVTLWANGQADPERLLVGAAIAPSQERYGLIEGRAAVVRLPQTVTALLAAPPPAATPAISATGPGSAAAPAASAAAPSHE